MYKRGSAKFTAADYKGAIEVWTELLSTLPDGADFEAIRLDLLYNIAIAHEREHSLDHNERHLRQALTLMRRYHEANPDAGAKEHIDRIEAKLAELEEEDEQGPVEPDPIVTAGSAEEDPKDDQPRRGPSRGLAIGLLAGGGAGVVGGVVLIVAGSRFKPNAEDQIAELDDLGVPDDHSSRDEAAQYLDDETRRGTTLMAVGGVLAGVGVAAIGIGAWAYVRSKKGGGSAASLRVSPSLGGMVLSGRF